MVDLFVGEPDPKLYRVHKILCQKIPYFKKMFESNFKEVNENRAKFPEDTQESFDLLLEWVYTVKYAP
jgi:hypothetical protein